jgi:hypothetical protein
MHQIIMKRLSTLLFSIFCLQVASVAQNARFSQVWSAPVQFNPALTGRFDGKLRASALMSFQQGLGYDWVSKSQQEVNMNHQNISIDLKLGQYRSSGDEGMMDSTSGSKNNNPKEGRDRFSKSKQVVGYWGVGMNYYTYGHESAPIKANFISVSAARHFYTKSNRIFGFGLQLTQANGNLDEKRGTTYDKEISGGGFRYPYPYGNLVDSPRSGTKSYTDVNIGAYYGRVTEAVMFELGGAMHHMFYPQNDADQSRNFDGEAKLRHRITAHSMLRLRLNNTWGIVQKNMYWQEGLYYRSRDTADGYSINTFWTGLEFYKVDPAKDININFGFYSRSFKTLMPYLNIGLSRLANIRYTYEQPINSSKFKAYNAKRNEISLIITAGRQTKMASRFYKKLNFW